MTDFGFDGVMSSSLAEFMSFSLFINFFFQLFFCIMYVTQTPQTMDNTRAAQGACYNQLWLQRLPPASRAGSNTTRVR